MLDRIKILKLIKLRLFVLSNLLVFIGYNAIAQDWVVPQDKKQQVSTFSFTENDRKLGEDLYNKNCASCHGNPGKNNYINLSPSPGDPASVKYQMNTDGELFFKITEGKGAMPSFKNSLDADQRWQIISYIRSFNPNYIQPEPVSAEVSAITGKLQILIQYIDSNQRLETTLLQKDNEQLTPVSGFQVLLFARRYFGNLPIDETKLTGPDGKAFFNLPNDLPGDSAGNINFRLKLINEGAGITMNKDTFLKVGIVSNPKALREQRTMWNHRSMAPMWLIISYTLLVLGVWGVIGYVLLLLKGIKDGSDK